jgi:hypothetical protein
LQFGGKKNVLPFLAAVRILAHSLVTIQNRLSQPQNSDKYDKKKGCDLEKKLDLKQ